MGMKLNKYDLVYALVMALLWYFLPIPESNTIDFIIFAIFFRNILQMLIGTIYRDDKLINGTYQNDKIPNTLLP